MKVEFQNRSRTNYGNSFSDWTLTFKVEGSNIDEIRTDDKFNVIGISHIKNYDGEGIVNLMPSRYALMKAYCLHQKALKRFCRIDLAKALLSAPFGAERRIWVYKYFIDPNLDLDKFESQFSSCNAGKVDRFLKQVAYREGSR